MHVRTCKWQSVHRHGVDESIQAIQSAFSADHLVASGAGETPAHGGRMAQEGMGLARSRKTEKGGQERVELEACASLRLIERSAQIEWSPLSGSATVTTGPRGCRMSGP